MVGIPDGLGAYDNGDGTITVLMNHELASNKGAVRLHGGSGAFVSEWVIEKETLRVRSGGDLIKKVYGWDAATQKSVSSSSVIAFNRFCSAAALDSSSLSVLATVSCESNVSPDFGFFRAAPGKSFNQ